MTELIYQTDSYCDRFTALVVEVDLDNGAVALDRTAFYPGGGGQPCDRGTLSGLEVSRVARNKGDVWHFLESAELPKKGERVVGDLDWQHRYLLMRTHSALHVLSAVVWHRLQAQVTGGSMKPGTGRLDFELSGLSRELVQSIEQACNEEVAAGREIVVRFLDRGEAEEIPDLIRTKVNLLPASITTIRAIEIVGLDMQADGGTHVADTSEIGPLSIPRYKSKGADNKRLYIELLAG